MPITTKRGDKGKTDLYFGGRVNKDDVRVEAYGSLDELSSYLGLAKSLVPQKKTKLILESIQRDLFTIGAEAATSARLQHKLKNKIEPEDVKRLEHAIRGLERTKKFKECCFYLPGENLASSSLDLARVTARLAERRMVALKRKRLLSNEHCLAYLNRVSDLLYLLARSYDKSPRRYIAH